MKILKISFSFAILLICKLNAMEYYVNREKPETVFTVNKNENLEMGNFFEIIPDEILLRFFNYLDLVSQKSLISVDKKFNKFKHDLNATYLGPFAILPNNILFKIFVDNLDTHKNQKTRNNVLNINKHFGKLIFEKLWSRKINTKRFNKIIKKSSKGQEAKIVKLKFMVEFACDINAWIWLKIFLDNHKNELIKNGITLEKLLVREISKGSPRYAICKVLLKHGAYHNIRNNDGKRLVNIWVTHQKPATIEDDQILSLLYNFGSKCSSNITLGDSWKKKISFIFNEQYKELKDLINPEIKDLVKFCKYPVLATIAFIEITVLIVGLYYCYVLWR